MGSLRRLPILLSLAALASCDGYGGSTGPDEGSTRPEATFTLTGATPRDGAPTVPVTTTVTFSFSAPIDPASVTGGTLSSAPTSYGTLSVEGSTLRFTPSTELAPGTLYVFSLSPDLSATNGQTLGAMPHPYGFKTAGSPPPPQDTVLLAPNSR